MGLGLWLAILLWLFGSGCSLIHLSPWRAGLDFQVSPGFKVGDSGRTTIHPTLGYGRASLDGGHGSILFVGGQVRYAPERFKGRLRGLWFGGEGGYARLSTVVTDPLVADPGDAGVKHGWRIAGLFGVPVYNGKLGSVHVYGSAGVIKFGGAGQSIRFGVELHPKQRAP